MADRPAAGSGEFDELLRGVRTRFIEAFPAEIDRLRALTAPEASEGHLQSIRVTAHRLAGSSGTLGFPSLGVAAAKLESFAMTTIAGGAQTSPSQVQTLDALIGELVEAYERDLTKPPAWAR